MVDHLTCVSRLSLSFHLPYRLALVWQKKMVRLRPCHLFLCFWSDPSVLQTVQHWVSVLLAVYGAALVVGSRTFESIVLVLMLLDIDLRFSHKWLFCG